MDLTLAIVGAMTALVAALGGLNLYQYLRVKPENRKTNAEADKALAEAKALLATAESQASSVLQAADGARIERLLAAQEAVLTNVQTELNRQRDLRETDRKDFVTEIGTWRERSAQCDERLAAEIRTREHEQILARERDISIADLRTELTLAMSELARLSHRADAHDTAVPASADLLRQAGVVLAKVEAVHDIVKETQTEVTTANGKTIAMLADLAESRRAEEIPEGDRTTAEQHAIDIVKEEPS